MHKDLPLWARSGFTGLHKVCKTGHAILQERMKRTGQCRTQVHSVIPVQNDQRTIRKSVLNYKKSLWVDNQEAKEMIEICHPQKILYMGNNWCMVKLCYRLPSWMTDQICHTNILQSSSYFLSVKM